MLAMVLLFIIVIGDMAGFHLSDVILSFCGGILTGILMSYFGKRDIGEEESRK